MPKLEFVVVLRAATISCSRGGQRQGVMTSQSALDLELAYICSKYGCDDESDRDWSAWTLDLPTYAVNTSSITPTIKVTQNFLTLEVAEFIEPTGNILTSKLAI